MNPTKNDLPEATRVKVAEMLNQRLCDAIDLQSQCKQAHWNIKGPNFIALHELFDKVNEDVEDYVDLIAERAVQLGGNVEGTVRGVARRTGMPNYPQGAIDQREHVEALSSALAAFGKLVRRDIDMAAGERDQDTADIMTEVSRGVDKWLWMVESHLKHE